MNQPLKADLFTFEIPEGRRHRRVIGVRHPFSRQAAWRAAAIEVILPAMDLFSREPVAQPLAARLRCQPRRIRRAGTSACPRQAVARGAGAGRAAFHGVLGPTRCRQDHPGAALGQGFRCPFRDGFRRARRGQGDSPGGGDRQQAAQYGRRTILFVDEVHRFNKSQQDAFPLCGRRHADFIGATTENPSFELNNALLSRARVYVLKSLDEAALRSW